MTLAIELPPPHHLSALLHFLSSTAYSLSCHLALAERIQIFQGTHLDLPLQFCRVSPNCNLWCIQGATVQQGVFLRRPHFAHYVVARPWEGGLECRKSLLCESGHPHPMMRTTR